MGTRIVSRPTADALALSDDAADLWRKACVLSFAIEGAEARAQHSELADELEGLTLFARGVVQLARRVANGALEPVEVYPPAYPPAPRSEAAA